MNIQSEETKLARDNWSLKTHALFEEAKQSFSDYEPDVHFFDYADQESGADPYDEDLDDHYCLAVVFSLDVAEQTHQVVYDRDMDGEVGLSDTHENHRALLALQVALCKAIAADGHVIDPDSDAFEHWGNYKDVVAELGLTPTQQLIAIGLFDDLEEAINAEGLAICREFRAKHVEERETHRERERALRSLGEELSEAAQGGDVDELAQLLTNPDCAEVLADSNYAADPDRSPLIWAAKGGHTKCALMLVEHSDSFESDSEGLTALMWAAKKGHLQCLQALLPHSDAEAVDPEGRTALMLAVDRRQVECAEALVHASDANTADNAGVTALMLAALNGDEESVLLLAPLSDVDARDEDGQTALMMAARDGHADCVELLLPVSDLGVVDSEGWTPLMYAAANDRKEIVELLAPRSDACAVSQDGRTALSVAAAGGRYGVADVLAPFSNPVEVERVFAQAGKERMPRWNARLESVLERDALAAEVAAAKRAAAAGDAQATQQTTASSVPVAKPRTMRI